MTADRPLRRSGILTFPNAPTDERELAAMLVTQDDAGNVHHFVRTGPEAKPIDDGIAAMFAYEVERAQQEER